MSAMSRRETSPVPSNTAVARSGSSMCTCTFSVRESPTTSTESPSCSSGAMKRVALSPSPVTAKLVQKRYVPELWCGCVTRAGAWCSSAGGSSPRSAATTPAIRIVSP